MEVGNQQAMTDQQRIAELEARLAMAVEALEQISARVRPVRAAWDNREVVGQGTSAEIRVGVCFGDLRKVAEAGGIADNALAATSEAVARYTAEVERRGAAKELRRIVRDETDWHAAAAVAFGRKPSGLPGLFVVRLDDLEARAAELEGA